MKAILIGALAATAYAADDIVIPGTYKVAGKTGAKANACCFPNSNGVTISKDGANYKLAWTFEDAPACTISGAKTKSLFGSGPTASSNGVTTISITDQGTSNNAGGLGATWKMTVPANANEDFVLDLSQVDTSGSAAGIDCQAVLEKAPATLPVDYSGVYEVKGKNGVDTTQCCYPTGDIIIRQPGAAGTTVTADWKFASAGTDCPAAAAGANLAGTSHTASGTPNSATGSVDLVEGNNNWGVTYAPNIAVTSGILFDLGAGVNPAGCAVSIAKKSLPDVKYVNVYEATGQNGGTDATCCYPATDVTVTADGTAYNVAWTFGEEAGCPAALKGQKVSAKNTPDVATKDVKITQTFSSTPYTFNLKYPTTATGDWTLDLSAINSACSVNLEKKSGYLVGLGSLVALSLSYIMF